MGSCLGISPLARLGVAREDTLGWYFDLLGPTPRGGVASCWGGCSGTELGLYQGGRLCVRSSLSGAHIPVWAGSLIAWPMSQVGLFIARAEILVRCWALHLWTSRDRHGRSPGWVRALNLVLPGLAVGVVGSKVQGHLRPHRPTQEPTQQPTHPSTYPHRRLGSSAVF